MTFSIVMFRTLINPFVLRRSEHHYLILCSDWLIGLCLLSFYLTPCCYRVLIPVTIFCGFFSHSFFLYNEILWQLAA